MTTINQIIEVLQKAGRPMTNAELVKATKLSGGAVGGAIWRLQENKAVQSHLVEGQKGKSYFLTGEPPPASKNSPTKPVTRRRRRVSQDTGVQFQVVLRLDGRSHPITLAQANEIYRQLSELLKPLDGAK